jgi:hypothetical protein
MRKQAPGHIDLAAAAAIGERTKGKHDHVSRADCSTNLDHLEQVGKPSIKQDGQRRRVQGDQRSHSSAGRLKVALLAPP